MKLRLVLPLIVALASGLALSLTACGGSSGGGGPSVAEFCSSYLVVRDKTTALSNASNGTLEERKKALGDFAGSLSDLASNSPDEIHDDVKETADWATGAEEAVSGADSISEFQKVGTAYGKENPQPQTASQKADDYESKNCENGDSTTATTSG